MGLLTYGLDSVSARVLTSRHLTFSILTGAVTDKYLDNPAAFYPVSTPISISTSWRR
jgi:hypothetical protein